MQETRNIALFGFMATGKSTVGHLVARQLGWSFIDVDDMIVEDAGCPITDIFAREGEAGFRKREQRAVRRAATLDHHVIATGGGVVLDRQNIDLLGTSSLLVCLTLSAEATYARAKGNTSRPLLQHSNPLARIRELLAERQPYYAAIPHQICRDELDPQQTAARIIALYESYRP